MKRTVGIAIGCLLGLGLAVSGVLQIEVQDESSRAYGHPLPNLTPQQEALFARGDAAFNAVFVRAGRLNPGLGPRFNNTSCAGCHVGDGRGLPIFGDVAKHSQGLLRVSLPGGQPVPGVGFQFRDQAVLGFEPDGTLRVEWEEIPGQYGDGTPYRLRKPKLTVTLANGKPLPAQVQTSLRVAPPSFGRGWLEAIPQAEILAQADPNDQDHDGISGRPNWVKDHRGKTRLGRFGLKANTADLLEQTAAAYLNDMGLGNPVFPDENGKVEISQQTLDIAVFYTQTLAVPARRNLSDPQVRQGEALFVQMGCSSCHTPRFVTGNDHPIAALRNQEIHPYSDLLLHDMGKGLADGRPDGEASGQEWRTPPLWGIGLTRTVLGGDEAYLHDGRARTLEEAILWHGGEAEAAKAAFRTAPTDFRAALLAFLKSL